MLEKVRGLQKRFINRLNLIFKFMIGFITWPISEEPLNHDFPPPCGRTGVPRSWTSKRHLFFPMGRDVTSGLCCCRLFFGASPRLAGFGSIATIIVLIYIYYNIINLGIYSNIISHDGSQVLSCPILPTPLGNIRRPSLG